jgi:CHAD domain-containing protein
MASRMTIATLEMPVDRAVRLVALALLGGAVHAAGKLQKDGMDPEKLHGFRVAVRRLRSWLTLWKPVLQGDIRRKDERRLRRIAGTTGPARDADMQLRAIAAVKRSAHAQERTAIQVIRAQFEKRREATGAAAVDAATDLLTRHRQMERRLAVHCVDVRDVKESETFGHALGHTTRAAADELRERLAVVASRDDANAIHKARISAKRLRFLMEPVQDLVPRAGPVIKSLQSLQDDAGVIHDARVLSDALAKAENGAGGFPTLAHRTGVKERKSAIALEARWLGASATPFFARVRRLVAELAT